MSSKYSTPELRAWDFHVKKSFYGIRRFCQGRKGTIPRNIFQTFQRVSLPGAGPAVKTARFLRNGAFHLINVLLRREAKPGDSAGPVSTGAMTVLAYSNLGNRLLVKKTKPCHSERGAEPVLSQTKGRETAQTRLPHFDGAQCDNPKAERQKTKPCHSERSISEVKNLALELYLY